MRTGRPFFVMACFSHFFFCKYQKQRRDDATHVSLTFANECAAHEINPQTRRRPLSRPAHPKPSTSRATTDASRPARAPPTTRSRAPKPTRAICVHTLAPSRAPAPPSRARHARSNTRITNHIALAKRTHRDDFKRRTTRHGRHRHSLRARKNNHHPSVVIIGDNRVAPSRRGREFDTHQSARETTKGLGSRRRSRERSRARDAERADVPWRRWCWS